jgi:hypothetical protein
MYNLVKIDNNTKTFRIFTDFNLVYSTDQEFANWVCYDKSTSIKRFQLNTLKRYKQFKLMINSIIFHINWLPMLADPYSDEFEAFLLLYNSDKFITEIFIESSKLSVN